VTFEKWASRHRCRPDFPAHRAGTYQLVPVVAADPRKSNRSYQDETAHRRGI
jgi:hypothetical protein